MEIFCPRKGAAFKGRGSRTLYPHLYTLRALYSVRHVILCAIKVRQYSLTQRLYLYHV
jgi:hypothetical protein